MQNPREQLLLSLKGQEVHIPDLTSVFEGWPHAINTEYHSIRDDVESRLESLFPGDIRLESLKASDFTMFGSRWWPNTNRENLRIVTYLSIWFFAWDDELDSEIGPIANDFGRGQRFRADSIKYIGYCLHLRNESSYQEPTNKIIKSFKVIADAICEVYTDAQKQILLKEMVFFMDSTETEQRVRLSDKLPTVGEYWQCRMGTSAVGVILAVNEFAYDIRPSIMMINQDMKTLWDYVIENVWLVNDMFSIKKELCQNTADSLIPLLFKYFGSAQAAIDFAVASLVATVDGFDKAAKDMLGRYQHDHVTQVALQSFLDGCRYICTGNLYWSLGTKRYGICQDTFLDGISVTL